MRTIVKKNTADKSDIIKVIMAGHYDRSFATWGLIEGEEIFDDTEKK